MMRKLLIGGIIGVGIGMLMAPRRGSEMRRDLMERSEKWRSRGSEAASTVRERVGPMVGTARRRMEPAVERARRRMGEATEQDGPPASEPEYDTGVELRERYRGMAASPIWLLAGGIIGVGIGMLMAPKRGSEMRHDLMERSEKLRSRGSEAASTVREQVGPMVGEARERVGPAVEGVRERVGPTVQTIRERVAKR